MKKNLNIIQIRGVKGLILAGFIVTCLFAGFIVFPGWVSMHCWNFISNYTNNLPQIGLFQGVLLWGIIVASYFIFRKEKVVVCMRSPQGLSEEELKSVFADIKKQSQEDPILQAMLKAKETELSIKKEQTASENTEQTVSTEQK